jgi:hypothetical protein
MKNIATVVFMEAIYQSARMQTFAQNGHFLTREEFMRITMPVAVPMTSVFQMLDERLPFMIQIVAPQSGQPAAPPLQGNRHDRRAAAARNGLVIAKS